MDFQSMMETFAEAWVAATTPTALTEATADHQNILLGLSGGSSGQSMDMTPADSLTRRLAASGAGSSAAQSPGLNLSSHTAVAPTEDDSLSPAFAAAANILDLKEAMGGNNARNTIPIHCVIERASPSLLSPGNTAGCTAGGSQGPSGSSASPPLGQSTSSAADLSLGSGADRAGVSSGGGTSASGVGGTGSSHGGHHQQATAGAVIEQDTYAILQASIPFNDIVRHVLAKLGYTPQETVGAKALVQLRNWKPLTLDQISESAETTLGEIFGDIASFITLRIRLFRPRMSAAHELKDKLLQVLLAHSYSLLANSGSPIDQILSSLVRGHNEQQQQQGANEEARRRNLDQQWYLQQVFNQYRQFAALAQQPQIAMPGLRPNSASSAAGAASAAHPLFLELNGLTNGNDSTLAAAAASLHPSLAAAAAAAAASVGRPTTNGSLGASSVGNVTPEKLYGSHKASNSSNHHTSSSGHHSSITSSRTRIRTSFDPELELPKLHKWFAENRHPSRSQVQEYVKELNSLESRKGRKPLDVNNVVYWFKNARAAHKRAELKFISNDSNNSSHAYNAFGQAGSLTSDFFSSINGGNHSPGKASSDASISGKCNDEPLSNASRNGSNMDDYYSFDEDGDSHEETQTLDLSVRNNVGGMQSKLFASSPASTEVKTEQEDSEEKIVDSELKGDSGLNVESEQGNADNYIKSEPMEHSGRDGGASSDCNSIEDDSEEETEATPSNNMSMSNAHIALNLTNLMNSSSATSSNNSSANNPESPEGRRTRRSRTFIDPMSEVPRLESWFLSNTHPAHSQIVRYTDELNKMPYRQKFPKLEPKNIQFWFKNRRAKIKRTSGLSPSALSLSAANASSANSNSTLQGSSLHNSSALNIERLINAH